jgi:hypothetical protein
MEQQVIDMAGITKKELSARRQRLLEELPNHGWDYVKAGIAAGYSPSYARARLKKYVTKDITFCQQFEAKRREIEAKTEDRREKRLRQLDEIIDDPKTTTSIKLKAIDLQGKMCAWHSNTVTLETKSRQRELDEAQRQEARRLALLRYNALPEVIQTDMVTSSHGDTETNNVADIV